MDWGMILSQFRGIHTLIMIAIFVGICIWAFSPQRRSENDKAAHLVFEDEDIDTRTRKQQRGSKDDE